MLPNSVTLVKGKIKKVLGPVPRAVRALLDQRGWTQKELADELGKTTDAIQHWEHGRRKPLPDTLLRLSGLAIDPKLKDIFAAAARPPRHSLESQPTTSTIQASAETASQNKGSEQELIAALKTILRDAPETIVEEVADRLVKYARVYRKSRRKGKKA